MRPENTDILVLNPYDVMQQRFHQTLLLFASSIVVKWDVCMRQRVWIGTKPESGGNGGIMQMFGEDVEKSI